MTVGSRLVSLHAEPDLPRAACREAWHALTEPLFAVAMLTPAERFRAAWTLHRLDRLIVSQVEFSAQEFVHDPRRHGADEGLLLLELYEAGHGRGCSGETPTAIDPRRLHLIDLSRPYRTVTTAVRAIGVVIPHAAVGYDPARHPAYLALPTQTPQGTLLAAALRVLVAQLPVVTVAEAPALGQAFAGLVRSLLLDPLAPRSPGDRRTPTAARVRGYIDRHLADELDAGQLSRRFGVSRATLYRLFQAEGGIEGYIRDRRLDRCSAELMLAPPERGRVRQVAERLGFWDAGHFTRAYRQRFGVAPSDHLGARTQARALVGGPAGPAACHDSVRLFGAWLRHETALAAEGVD